MQNYTVILIQIQLISCLRKTDFLTRLPYYGQYFILFLAYSQTPRQTIANIAPFCNIYAYYLFNNGLAKWFGANDENSDELFYWHQFLYFFP